MISKKATLRIQRLAAERNPDECWPWPFYVDKKSGYGRYRTKDDNLLAHRLAYEVLVGPIPDELQIDHLCRTRARERMTRLRERWNGRRAPQRAA